MPSQPLVQPRNCSACGKTWIEHGIYHEQPPPDAVAAEFPDDGGPTWSGLYCLGVVERSDDDD